MNECIGSVCLLVSTGISMNECIGSECPLVTIYWDIYG